jgi:hypothetical protein
VIDVADVKAVLLELNEKIGMRLVFSGTAEAHLLSSQAVGS